MRRTEDSNKITRQVQEQKRSSPVCSVVMRMLISEQSAISGRTARLTATQFRLVSRLRPQQFRMCGQGCQRSPLQHSHSQAIGVKSYLNQIKHTTCSRCLQQKESSRGGKHSIWWSRGLDADVDLSLFGKTSKTSRWFQIPSLNIIPSVMHATFTLAGSRQREILKNHADK
jgi:hypothetical protein